MKRTMRVPTAAVSLCAGLFFLTVSASTSADARVSAATLHPVATQFGARSALLGQDTAPFRQVKKTKAERKAKREAKRKARKERRAARKAKRSQPAQ